MATNYPSSLDNSTTLPVESSSTALSVNHVVAHQNIQDAIEAIEAKVGVDSSAVTTSHDYKLGEVTSTDKAVGKTATQTLTNKTLTSPTVTGATITTSTVNGVTLTTGGAATDFLAANGSYVAGSVSNASTTAKGIVEAATSAEVTAGTATGGTGAVLAVTPDALAASTPVFNGSALTAIPHRIATTTTDVTVASTTTETNLFSQSIPGGTLSTANYIRAVFYITVIKTTNAAQTCTIRVKYGATTLITDATFTGGGAAGNAWSGRMEVLLASAGTTSSQNAVYTYSLSPGYTGNGNAVAATFSNTAQGTSSEDSTAAKTFAVTAQMSNNSANDTITAALITVESVA